MNKSVGSVKLTRQILNNLHLYY